MDYEKSHEREINIPYGGGHISAHVDGRRVEWLIDEIEHAPIDFETELRHALENPVGSESLSQLITDKKPNSVLILIDDNTRATPQSMILPILTETLLDLGVKSENITIMVCLGTHRPLSNRELCERVGKRIYDTFRCLNLSQDSDDFIDYGVTASGTPIEVSKEYMRYDFKIAVGNIIPHMYAGWAGGAKMVQPGVTSALTTARTHLLAAHSINNILGEVENPIRHEMEEIAVRTGLDFIVNTVIDNFNTVVAIIAGDVVAAHRSGVAIAKPIFTHEIERRVPIVIAGAHPADRDLWQGFKPLHNCGLAVEDGGVLILVIEAPEGIAFDHPQLVALGTRPIDDVLHMLSDHEIKDEVAAATYMAYRATKDRVAIILVSDGISEEEALKIGAYSVKTIQEAINIAEMLVGRDKIGIIPYGADIIIKVKNA